MRSGLHLGLAALVTVAAAAARPALAADGALVTVEPSYTHEEVIITDDAGSATRTTTDSFNQRFGLTLDRSLTDQLDATLGGTFLHQRAWRGGDAVVDDDVNGRAYSFFGRLGFGTPALNWGLGVDRRSERALGAALEVVSENYAANALWRPLDLPELSLRLARTNARDANRTQRDTTTDTAALGLRMRSTAYDARYNVSWARVEDHLEEATGTEVDQNVHGSWSGTFFANRMSAYLSANLETQNTLTDARGPGATVTQLRPAVAGFSAIEAPPATPANVVLSQNGALVDGDLTASAAVNVGVSRSTAGDRDPRAVGGSFADLVTKVNTIWVWLDRPLTDSLYAALGATAQVWQSDDNRTWTAVTLVPTVTWSAFESRLVVTLPETAARYLKVSLQPLDVTSTTDPAYRDVFVTEVQFALVLPASQVPRRSHTYGGGARAYARTVLVDAASLAHDVALSVSRTTEQRRTQYSVTNGLSAAHQVWGVTASARGARIDGDAGTGHEGVWEWSAALAQRPVPTASWSLTYAGRSRDLPPEEEDGPRIPELTHSLSAFGRADWYPGISSQLNAVGSVVAVNDGARTATSLQGSTSTSVIPNRWVALTFGGLYDWSIVKDITRSDVKSEYARVDAGLMVTPAPALSASGTVSRVLLGERKSTVGSVQLSYFPLRGDLQLSVGYSSTLDTAAQTITSQFSPSLRWNVRRGVSLTLHYTWLKNDAPVQVIESRAAGATLLITL